MDLQDVSHGLKSYQGWFEKLFVNVSELAVKAEHCIAPIHDSLQ